ncbi:MAG: SufD family Fe-S cluster assembly protein [Anaerolineae bacterium]|nr:SufD family Fe-S cluster assembly protein [Anaerolineae bacterium]MDW8101657.1 SufD family Fe-S cluster assembly protein [Anaerolineae bacterium]
MSVTYRISTDFEAIVKAYEKAGGKPEVFRSPRIASLVVSGNKVLLVNEIPGIRLESEELPSGVRARVKVEPGVRLEYPVHLCFGLLPKEGEQEIYSQFEIGEGAWVAFVTHCTFPNAVNVRHVMDAEVRVSKGALMHYRESHYHGEHGGTVVLPQAKVIVEEEGRYFSEFVLTSGRVGKLELNYVVDVGPKGVAELVAKAYGYGEDSIIIKETIRLNGERARGLTKARIAVRGKARSEVHGITEGNAPFTRGHLDCIEIVRDEAIANAIPIVLVRDPTAHVTHEAAIGTVDKKGLETLMARGLSEEEAVDIIIKGMLGG